MVSAIGAGMPSKEDKEPGDVPAAAETTRPAPVVMPPKDPAPELAPAKPAAAISDPIAAAPQPAPSSDPVPAPADSIADDDVGKKDSSIDRPQPGDVAAAEKASAAEKAAAAERAAQEKIIASGQYYLPIAGAGKHRGVQRAVLILLLVILLGLAWLDIAMDAGILHIHGVQPVTHFFGNRI